LSNFFRIYGEDVKARFTVRVAPICWRPHIHQLATQEGLG
jgi:hypothetical protein